MPQPTKAEIRTQQRHDRLMLLVEAPYMRAIIRAKNKYITAVSKAYALDGTLPEALTFAHKQEMFELGKRYNSRIIKIMSRDVQGDIAKNQLLILEFKDEAFDRWLAGIIGFWLGEETAVAAGVTALTTRSDIVDAIRKSTIEGETSAQIAKKILKVKGLSAFRAEVIARTETHNAAMFANKESGKRLIRETDVELLKIWVPVQDSRTREVHSNMVNHSPIIMDSLFTVGRDRMDRPGDPRGSAGNVINCRCTLAYRVAK